MTSRIPAIIPSILESSSLSLLYMEPEISPESNMDLAASRSLALASSMAARLESNATAIASRALSFTSVDRTERGMDASFALFTSDTTSDISYRLDMVIGCLFFCRGVLGPADGRIGKRYCFYITPSSGCLSRDSQARYGGGLENRWTLSSGVRISLSAPFFSIHPAYDFPKMGILPSTATMKLISGNANILSPSAAS